MKTSNQYPPARGIKDIPGLPEALKKRIAECHQTSLRQGKAKSEQITLNKTARDIIDLASHYLYEPVNKLFDRIGTVSPATQAATIKKLEQMQMIKTDQVRMSRSSVRLFELTEEAWKYLKKSPPKRKGRGGIVHRHFSAWISTAMAKKGYKTEMEFILPQTNHPVDVIAEKDGVYHAYEVVAECMENIVNHVKACFVSTNAVASLTIVAAQKSKIREIENLVQSDPIANQISDRVHYETIDIYLQEAFQ